MLLVSIIIGTNIATLPTTVIAASSNLSNQNSKTNHDNVEFNSYFEGNTHEIQALIGKTVVMYLNVKVSNNGYLKNGVVKFVDSNYVIDTEKLKGDIIQKATENELVLKQVNTSSQATIIEVPIQMKQQDKVSTDIFQKESKVIFSGTYIDGKGKEKEITKTIINEVSFLGKAEAELTGEVTKYVPYQLSDEAGTFMQIKVQASIKNNTLPFAKKEITLEVPKIGGMNPTRVNVIASQEKIKYFYNNQTGVVTITTENEKDANGFITWTQNEQEAYFINCIYQNQVLTPITGNIPAKTNQTVYNAQMATIEKQIDISYDLQNQMGSIHSLTIEAPATVSKGYLYANTISKQKQETPYITSYTTQIVDAKFFEQFEITLPKETWNNYQGEQVSANQATVIKTISIDKTVFEQVLGQEGIVEIFEKDGMTKIAELNAQTAKEGAYQVDITEAQANEVILKASQPIAEGIFTITVERAIDKQAELTVKQVQNMAQLLLEAQVKSSLEEQKIAKAVSLTEPTTKAELMLQQQKLSTILPNQDVEMRVVLDTSSTERALFKNPIFEIEMPENVETVILKNVDLFLENELTIKESKVENRNGKQVIVITLEGTQTQYIGSNIAQATENLITKGGNLVIKTDITLKKLTPSKTENVIMNYHNNNTEIYAKETLVPAAQKAKAVKTKNANNNLEGVSIASVNLVAPSGVVAANHVYHENDINIMNMTDEKQDIKIQAYSEAKQIKVEGIIVNNYENAIQNVVVLGRTLAAENKMINSEKELRNTFTAPLTGAITVGEVKSKVYYSENGEATKDLQNAQNGWTLTPSDFGKVKSYCIVLEQELKQGEQVSFQYSVQVPQNLAHNQSSYEMYVVSYENKTTQVTTQETKVSGIVGLTTGEGPELEVTLNANMTQNSEVHVGQIVRFTATVKNTGKVDSKNVTVNIPVPEGTKYVEYDSTTQTYQEKEEQLIQKALGTLKAGETASCYYELQMQEMDDEEEKTITTIGNQVKVNADDLDNSIPSNEYSLKKTKAKVVITNTIPNDPDYPIKKGNTLYSTIIIEPIENITNAVVSIEIPQGIIIKQATYHDDEGNELQNNINVKDNKVTVTLPNLQAYSMQAIYLTLEIGNMKGNFSYVAQMTADNMPVHTSNVLQYVVAVPNFEITQTSSNQRYIKETQQITYQFTIKNTGNADADNVIFENALPKGLSFVKLLYEYQGKTTEITSSLHNTAKIRWATFEKGATSQVTVIAQASLLPTQEEQEVKNSATIEAEGLEKITSNSITNIVEYNKALYQDENGNTENDNEQTNPQDPNHSAAQGGYKITGTAWLDSNQNGQKEEGEELLSGIQVILLQKETNQIVKDQNSGESKITTTDVNGKYEFTNLAPGNYLVVFLYDAGNYNVTEYQKQKVSQSYNSDARTMKITLNGTKTYAGVTDTILVNEDNVRDIDLGLYVAQKFDLKLDKYISKTTLTTPTVGTQVLNYQNKKLVKVEVLGKNVNKSSIVIEYKIVVTNEGQVPGYAKKIVDYLPEDTKFSSELNQDWYLSANGQAVYNTSLENTKINPGESKEVTLVLSMQISDKTIGNIVNNNAEIYESYNEQGLADIDSQGANRVQGEDDMSQADIVLAVVTGKMILSVTLVIAILFLLVLSILIIQRKVLYKRR